MSTRSRNAQNESRSRKPLRSREVGVIGQMSRRAASLLVVVVMMMMMMPRAQDCDSITLGTGEPSDSWHAWDVGEPTELWDNRRPGDPGDQQVRVLRRSEVDPVLQAHPAVFLLFTAPWCTQCTALVEEFEKLALRLRKEPLPLILTLARLDASTESELAREFNVRGFPALRLVRIGLKHTSREYTGARTASDMYAWLKRRFSASAKVLPDGEAAAEFVSSLDLVAVGFFKDGAGEAAGHFMAAADEEDIIPFGISTSAEAASRFGLCGDTVVLFKKFDEGRVDHSGEMTKEAISSFVRANELPLVMEFSEKTTTKVFGGDIKAHLLLFMDHKDPSFPERLHQLRVAARDFRGKILFLTVDIGSKANERLLQYFGVQQEERPSVRLISLDSDMSKYSLDAQEGIAVETLLEFCEAFLGNKLKPNLASQPLPEDWDSLPLKVLVGENFERVALDPRKNVFVLFYVPWCGRCKSLLPVWEKLAERLEHRPEVVIAKFDGSANEVHAVKVQGYPSLTFFPAGKEQQVLRYKGELNLDEFLRYLEKEVQEASTQQEERGEASNAGARSMEDVEKYEEAPDAEKHEEGHDEEKDTREEIVEWTGRLNNRDEL
uniref:protein disulfide-isomerase-like n=1 Tax=Myxine glutinosa TaxID=7769 RepID=UPI00358F6C61